MRSTLLAGKDTKKETKLGLSAKKASDFGEWYPQVVVESEMISYYDVSGAASVRHPYGFSAVLLAYFCSAIPAGMHAVHAVHY